ncbi:MAG: hypothetical protein U1F43_18840 [Myxococcota bacterium]
MSISARAPRKSRQRGRQALIDEELRATNVLGGYHGSIVCTDQGLLVARDGDIPSDEALAGFASLFDEIVTRGGRHLALGAIEEVTVLDRQAGRLVIRPLPFAAADDEEQRTRIFLVLWMSADATWRRNAARLALNLAALLADVVGARGDD